MDYFPDLPVDVVRLLMEAAAWSDRSTAHSLSLVSKDVHQWIEPTLYHTVFLDTPTKVSSFAGGIVARTRDNPNFFHRTVKVLTIGGLDSEAFPRDNSELDESISIVVKACTNIKRFSYWTPIQVDIFHQGTKCLRPSHVSLILEKPLHLFAYLTTLASPTLTHLHLDFPSHVHFCRPIGIWAGIFKESPRLTHVHLSGGVFAEMDPRLLIPVIHHIVAALPQTLIRLLFSAISFHTQTDDAPIPVQLKQLQSDARIVFILPTTHALNAVEKLQPHEDCRERPVYLDWRSHEDLWGVIEGLFDIRASRQDLLSLPHGASVSTLVVK